MKEQKELIEAALEIAADIENNPYCRRDELDSKLVQAAKAYRQAQEQEQPERRQSPWPDCYGSVLFEGDIVQDEEDGGIGEILFNDKYKGSQHQWFIKYEGDQHSSNLFNRVHYPGLRKIGNNFPEVYGEEPQHQPRKAPWTDAEGNELFEGDEVESDRGKIGTILYGTTDFWNVCFDNGVTTSLDTAIKLVKAVKVNP